MSLRMLSESKFDQAAQGGNKVFMNTLDNFDWFKSFKFCLPVWAVICDWLVYVRCREMIDNSRIGK